MDKMPVWARVAIVVGVCGLLAFGAWKSYPNFSQEQSDIDGKQQEHDRLQAEIAKGREAARRRAELEKLIAQKDIELASLRRILPTEPEAGIIIKWLESQASRFNLGIKSLSEASIKQGEFYKEYTYSMNVVGNYHDLGRFYDVIGKHDRIINVRNVSITKNSGADARSRSIVSSFSALTFVYTEKEG
ncbi:MAG: type 4a pilus biogenesis protein PilO [Acidobacteria bacterium]|nr:type 4a pilus biogenesis protein PilO [Acidobacteriota bacterium]